MIRINLLDYRKEKIKSRIQMEIAAAILSIFVVVGIVMFISTLQGKEINRITAVKDKKNRELQSLKFVEAKVAKSEKMQKRLETIVKTIGDLKKNQKEPARLFDAMLNNRLPTGEVWIQSVSENPSTIVLSGFAFRDKAISAYMESLQNMGAFTEVVLEYVKQSGMDGRKIKNFKLNCMLQGNLYSEKKWTRSGHPGGLYGMGGQVENVFSRQAAFDYGQQLSNELKQQPRNPFVEARNRAREKAKNKK